MPSRARSRPQPSRVAESSITNGCLRRLRHRARHDASVTPRPIIARRPGVRKRPRKPRPDLRHVLASSEEYNAYPPPARFARYMARSACTSSSSGSMPCSGETAIPMLRPMSSTALRMRSAVRIAPLASVLGRTAANSSPPIRAGRVLGTKRDLEAQRDLAQHFVPRMMPLRVVDLLEFVEVHRAAPRTDRRNVPPHAAPSRDGRRARCDSAARSADPRAPAGGTSPPSR